MSSVTGADCFYSSLMLWGAEVETLAWGVILLGGEIAQVDRRDVLVESTLLAAKLGLGFTGDLSMTSGFDVKSTVAALTLGIETSPTVALLRNQHDY